MNAQPKLLIIEDDEDIRATLKEVLEIDGFENVLTATHGQEGIEVLMANPDCDLILLDLMMPVMDGWTFLEHRSNSPELDKIPVVVISAAGERSKTTRADMILGKPVEIKRLLNTIHKFVDPPPPPEPIVAASA